MDRNRKKPSRKRRATKPSRLPPPGAAAIYATAIAVCDRAGNSDVHRWLGEDLHEISERLEAITTLDLQPAHYARLAAFFIELGEIGKQLNDALAISGKAVQL